MITGERVMSGSTTSYSCKCISLHLILSIPQLILTSHFLQCRHALPSLCHFPLSMMSCQVSIEAYDDRDINADKLKTWMTQTYLGVDPEEVCYDTRHLSWVLLLALPSFVIYAGLPVVSFLILWRQRDFHKSKKYMFRMGLLYSGYAKHRWWWECVVLRKLSVILIASFFYSDGLQLQIA